MSGQLPLRNLDRICSITCIMLLGKHMLYEYGVERGRVGEGKNETHWKNSKKTCTANRYFDTNLTLYKNKNKTLHLVNYTWQVIYPLLTLILIFWLYSLLYWQANNFCQEWCATEKSSRKSEEPVHMDIWQYAVTWIVSYSLREIHQLNFNLSFTC